MKQIIQNLKSGEVSIEQLPTPSISPNKMVIQTSRSLVSLGTERMLLNFGRAGYMSKARQQPDKVAMVLNKIKTDGLKPTINSVQNKLDQPMSLGYSNVGVVLKVGKNIKGFKVGDRVVSNGIHADIVSVPQNLCAKIPDTVTDDQASFTVVGAIALQGVRLVEPTLGETVVVVGLGLIGLITCQILKANGCEVIGMDLDQRKVDIAKSWGVTSFKPMDNISSEKNILALTDDNGADAVIITASTKSNDPIELAPKICRHRGRVILVGVTGLTLNRTEFFKKEISFQVSCSYGPGRYDDNYEQNSVDYPIGFVRWTEQRNFQAILKLIENENLTPEELITNKSTFEEAPSLYEKIGTSQDLELGIILDYPQENIELIDNVQLSKPVRATSITTAGVIGAGNFTSAVILPELSKTGIRLKTISSSNGLSGSTVGKKFKIENNTTDNNNIFKDDEIDTVIITTPHNTHANLVLQALEENKNIFTEKPLCLNSHELEQIITKIGSMDEIPILTVGFNRRFSPLSVSLKKKISNLKAPKSFIMTVNSGFIPNNHWTQDPKIGGGRLLGEACHFVDLLRYLAGKPIIKSSLLYIDSESNDTFTINLTFSDSSIGTIHYFSNGNKQAAKEKLEVFCQGDIHILDNFRSLKSFYSSGKKEIHKLSSQDKGHQEELVCFTNSTKTQKQPIDLNEILEVTRVCIELNEQFN